jgi:hypothetical protein
MADDAESSEKQNFVGEKKKSHGATRHCSYGTCNSDSRYSDREHVKGVFLDPVSQTKAKLGKMSTCGFEHVVVNFLLWKKSHDGRIFVPNIL